MNYYLNNNGKLQDEKNVMLKILNNRVLISPIIRDKFIAEIEGCKTIVELLKLKLIRN